MHKYQKKLIYTLLMSFFISASAHAQYVWVDEKGVKQFSDTPPPISVPKSRILKSPNKQYTEAAAQEAPATAASPEQARQPVTTASRNADFMKRKAEQAEKEQKASEEKRVAGEKSKNCERARDYQRALDSGVRIANTDSNGERGYLTDEQRAQEAAEAKRALSGCQ